MNGIRTKLLATASLILIVLWTSAANAQTIRGEVTDGETGATLPGVNILLEGSGIGTSTDSDGRYELSVPSLEGTLNFSYIGYLTEQVSIDGRESIDVSLRVSEVLGDELVVVGYGSQRRGDVTGAIGSVNARDFNRGLTTSPGELMQGKIAGVNVTAQGGAPGSPQTITIRGPGTLRSGSGPLYVIDGIAIDNSDTAPSGDSFGMSGASPTNPLAFLNQNDIESIDVLKDASATAIYGSRGANGVVLITTKRGEAGPSQLNYQSSAGISTIANRIDMLSPDEFIAFQESRSNGEGDQYVLGNRTNFFDEIMQTGFSNDHSISYSGGTSTSTFHASVNFGDQEGIVKGSGLQRYGGRIRLDQRFIDNRLKLGLNLNASRTNTDFAPIGNSAGVSGDMLSHALILNPTYPTHNEDGSFFTAPDQAMNPLQALEHFTNMSQVTRVLGSLEAEFEFMEGLMYRGTISIDNANGNQISQVSPHNVIYSLSNPEGRFVDSNRENSNFQTESTLNYLFNIDAHNFDLLGGYSYQRFFTEGRSWSIQDFSTTEIDAYRNPGIGTSLNISQNRPSGFSAVNELQSFFGRVNYNFDSRYYLTGTVRADGSSRFGADNRYGIFPSFSAAWQITNESFVNIPNLSNLRLRAGWGQTGNQDIPNGITQELINVGTGTGSGYMLRPGEISSGISFVRTQNESIQWEVSTQSNVGLDFGLFNNALYGTVDLFRKVTTDILFETTTGVDPIVATNSFWSNYDMEIVNQGVELALAYQQNIGTDFSFNIGGNISFIDNEIRKMPVSLIRTGSISGRGLSGERVQAFLNGRPYGAFWLHDWQGLDENGNNIFRDVDGDGNITNADHIYAGSALPDFTYGLTTDIAFRNFDLALNFNGVSGNMIYWNDHNAYFNMPLLYGGNNIARVGFNPDESPTNSAAASTRFLYDGSYFRLNNATLGYNVNTSGIGWLGALRFSVTGQNLFTLTDYPGFDPEVDTPRSQGGFQSSGIDGTRYPTARTILFGINLTL